jgi:hypothetical protein
MKKFVCLFPLLLPSSALAESYLITRLAEGGIRAVAIEMPVEEWAAIQGFPAAQSAGQSGPATGVILEAGQPPRLTYETLEALDRRFGGDGIPDTPPPSTMPANTPPANPAQPLPTAHIPETPLPPAQVPDVIPLADIPEGVPMELIDRESITYIALRDGLWKSTLDFNFEAGCPPQVGPAVRAMVGNGATTRARFSSPYHPTDFSDQLAFAPWKRVSANGFVAGPFSPSGAAGMPPGMSFSILYIMEAVSPEQVNVWAQVILTLPPAIAAMIGGRARCLAEGNGTYTYIGD